MTLKQHSLTASSGTEDSSSEEKSAMYADLNDGADLPLRFLSVDSRKVEARRMFVRGGAWEGGGVFKSSLTNVKSVVGWKGIGSA